MSHAATKGHPGICKHANDHQRESAHAQLHVPRQLGGKQKVQKLSPPGWAFPMYYTCSANTRVYDFLGQMLPETNSDDILCDRLSTLERYSYGPPSAYKNWLVWGIDIWFRSRKNKRVMSADAKLQSGRHLQDSGFTMWKLSRPAIKNGYLWKSRSPTVIANPGNMEVGLECSLDRCANLYLLRWLQVRTQASGYRHRSHYEQQLCRLPRYESIRHFQNESDYWYGGSRTDILAERAMRNIKAVPIRLLLPIWPILSGILTNAARGNHGKRRLLRVKAISWVQSYMVCGSILDSAKYRAFLCIQWSG